MNELTEKIQQWAVARNLHDADPHKQMLKLIEEVGEIAAGLARGNVDEVKDGIGDVKIVATISKEQLKNGEKGVVTKDIGVMLCLMIDVGRLASHIMYATDNEKSFESIRMTEYGIGALADEIGSSIEECTALAWDEIKDRKGKMISGVFVKEADFELCSHNDDWDNCPDCRH